MAGSAVSWLGSTLAVCAALTACSAGPSGTSSSSSGTSSDSSTSAPTTTSATPSTSVTSSAPAATSGSPSATSTRATTPPAAHGCANGDLTVAVGRAGAATGHVGVALVFTNVSETACSLYGYPGVAGLDSQGRQVTQATRSSSGFLGGTYVTRTVVVPPGGSASALVEGSDVPTGSQSSCTTYSALLVTAPGQTLSHLLRVSVPGCPTIQVHPVVSGVDGRA